MAINNQNSFQCTLILCERFSSKKLFLFFLLTYFFFLFINLLLIFFILYYIKPSSQLTRETLTFKNCCVHTLRIEVYYNIFLGTYIKTVVVFYTRKLYVKSTSVHSSKGFINYLSDRNIYNFE
jgi:hypothetical protein